MTLHRVTDLVRTTGKVGGFAVTLARGMAVSRFTPTLRTGLSVSGGGGGEPSIPCTLAPHDACSWPRPCFGARRRGRRERGHRSERAFSRARQGRLDPRRLQARHVGAGAGGRLGRRGCEADQEVRADSRRARLGGTRVDGADDQGAEPRPARRVRGAELHPPRGRRLPERSVLLAALGPAQHRPERELHRGHAGCRHRRPRGVAVYHRQPNVVVAVIDTGVDIGHPDLAPNIWINAGEDCPGCRTNGIDDDGNGYVDDWRGWDFANGDNNPTDDNGHGTHVAGTDRRRRQQRRRRRRRELELADHAAQVPGRRRLRHDRRRDQRDPLRARQGRPDPEQLVGRRRGFSQALLGRDPAADASGAAVRRRRGQRLHEHRRRAVLPARLRRAERPRRSARPTSSTARPGSRTTGRAPSTSSAPGTNIYSTWTGRRLPLRRRNLDGDAPGLGAAALAKACFRTRAASA